MWGDAEEYLLPASRGVSREGPGHGRAGEPSGVERGPSMGQGWTASWGKMAAERGAVNVRGKG